MLNYPPRKTLDTKASCSYELAMLIAKRARQLVDGGQPLVKDKAANMVSLACIEVNDDKVVGVPGEHSREIYVPKTRAAIQAEKEAKRAKQETEYYREMSAKADAEQEKKEETVDPDSIVGSYDPNEEIVMESEDDEETVDIDE